MKRITRKTVPHLKLERELWLSGAGVVVGVDEVGRGAWAGPITVGAAVLPMDRRLNKIRDSKLLSESEREQIFDRLTVWCSAWSVGHATNDECDQLGMADAQRLAAKRAIDDLGVTPDHVLVDGNWDFVGVGEVHKLIKGDAHCLSIATASILAKVSRDRIMREQAVNYPSYFFDSNKGYPCPRHKNALLEYGLTNLHRKSWAFMENLRGGFKVNSK